MNNPYDPNLEKSGEGTPEMPHVTEQAKPQEPTPSSEAQTGAPAGNPAAGAYTTSQSTAQQPHGGYAQGGAYGAQTGAYGTQAGGYRPPYSTPYGAQGRPYGAPQYGGYYGSYGQAPSPTSSPYMSPMTRPVEKKPASKGFVIGALAIALAISFFINLFVIAVITSDIDDDGFGGFNPGGNVVIEYAPKDDSKPAITDKGVSAYVASVAANTVVEVTTETVATDSYFGQYITQGAGSGVIISSNATESYILTCAHVIEGAAKVTVKLKDGTVYEAESFICDAESDVGVIKLNVTGLPTAKVADFSTVVVGETVVAIGNPLGTLGGSVTNGIVSALDRDIIIDGTTYHLLQTNAEINPGNSGGGLFNADGSLIGIVNAKSTGENVEGLGFAIPIDDAVKIMTDLIEKGYVSGRVKLGFELFEVQDLDDVKYWFKYSRYFTDFGVYIASAESPDFQEGDLLLAIDSVRIATLTDVKALLQDFEIGQTVKVTVSRLVGNKVQTFDYDLVLTEKKA